MYLFIKAKKRALNALFFCKKLVIMIQYHNKRLSFINMQYFLGEAEKKYFKMLVMGLFAKNCAFPGRSEFCQMKNGLFHNEYRNYWMKTVSIYP